MRLGTSSAKRRWSACAMPNRHETSLNSTRSVLFVSCCDLSQQDANPWLLRLSLNKAPTLASRLVSTRRQPGLLRLSLNKAPTLASCDCVSKGANPCLLRLCLNWLASYVRWSDRNRGLRADQAPTGRCCGSSFWVNSFILTACLGNYATLGHRAKCTNIHRSGAVGALPLRSVCP